jgi:hypothetical protein
MIKDFLYLILMCTKNVIFMVKVKIEEFTRKWPKKKLFVQNTLQKINWTSDILVQKINWTSDILVYVPDIYVQVQDFFF